MKPEKGLGRASPFRPLKGVPRGWVRGEGLSTLSPTSYLQKKSPQ